MTRAAAHKPTAARAPYRISDQLFLWLVTIPDDPVLIGELNMVRSTRGVSLRYVDRWIERGFALSEDLPLVGEELFPTTKDTAAGAVDDARPDRWGERVIRVLDKPPRLSLLEYLYFAGDDRFGALGVSTSKDKYLPRRTGPLAQLVELTELQALVRKVLANEPIPEPLRRLISPGATMGGARPKALLEIDGEQWVVKFSDGDPIDTPLIEHASMTLLRAARIRAAETRPLKLVGDHAVAIKRFDRAGRRRIHALSANVALKAAADEFGYPELAQLLRRRGIVERGVNREQMAELFRRMVFNILLDNTDDHEKNHVVLVGDAQTYELSPAFDVLPSGQALGYQQMRVGRDQADSTLVNAMSMCGSFGLTTDQAAREARVVIRAIDRWKKHFRSCGVSARDIESLAEQIDRPFLATQRREF